MALGVMGTVKIVIQVQDLNSTAATKRVEQNMQRVQQSVKRTTQGTQKDFAQVAGAFTTMFVAREAGRALMGMLAPAANLQEGLKKLEAMTELSEEALDRLGKVALRVARETAFDPTEALEGLRLLMRASLDAASAAEALGPVMKLAQVGIKEGLDVAQAANIAGTFYRVFRMEISDMEGAFDKLFVMSKTLNFGLQGMSDVMGKLGGAAQLTGTSYDDLLVSFGLATTVLKSNARAAQGVLRLSEVLKDATKAEALERATNVKIIDRETGQLRELSQIALEISQQPGFDVRNVEEFEEKLRGTITNVRALRPLGAMIAAFQQGIKTMSGEMLFGEEAMRFLRGEMEQSGGTLSRMAKKELEAATKAWGELGDAVTALFATLGTDTMGAVSVGIKVLIDAVTALTDAFDDPVFGTVMKWLFGIFAFASLAGIAVMLFRGGIQIMNVALEFAFPALKAVAVAEGEVAVGANVAAASTFRAGAAIRSMAGAAITARPALTKAAFAAKALGTAFAWTAALLIGWEVLEVALKSVTKLTGQSLKLQRIEQFGLWDAMKITFRLATEEEIMRKHGISSVRELGRTGGEAATVAQRAQERWNGSLADYLELVKKAGEDPFPPEFHEEAIVRSRRAFEELARAGGEIGERAEATEPVLDRVDELYAKMGRGAQLSAVETAQLRGDLELLMLQSGALLGAEHRITKAYRKEFEAAEQLSSATNVLARQRLVASGLAGEVSDEELAAARRVAGTGLAPGVTPKMAEGDEEIRAQFARMRGRFTEEPTVTELERRPMMEAAGRGAQAPEGEAGFRTGMGVEQIVTPLANANLLLTKDIRALRETLQSGLQVELHASDTGVMVGRVTGRGNAEGFQNDE